MTEEQKRISELEIALDHAQQELKETQTQLQLLNTVNETMPSLIWIKDSDHRLVYYNPAFEAAFGLEKDAWLNKSGWDLFPEEQARAMANNDNQVFRARVTLRTVETITFGGTDYHFLSFKFPLRTPDVSHIAGISIDITTQVNDERRLRDEIVALESSSKIRERLMSVIGHDVRTPIATVGQLAMLLKERSNTITASELENYLGEIVNSSETIQDTINQLLGWVSSQQQQLKARIKALPARRLTEQSWELMRQSAQVKKLEFTNNIEPDLLVAGDSNMFQTVMRNFLSNAIKFTPENGKISAEMELIGEDVSISVKDQGTGISDNQLERILTSNNITPQRGTNRERGSGLGLAICKDLLEKQSGTFTIKSSQGEGTTVGMGLSVIDKESELYQLVYQSNSQETFSKEQIETMSHAFSNRNASDRVTGLLFYVNGRFIQILEGHRLIVESLYDEISADERHFNCIKLLVQPGGQRLFPDWGMTSYFPDDKQTDAQKSLEQFMTENCSHPENPVAQTLMSLFSASLVGA